jgi:hypothetical protein
VGIEAAEEAVADTMLAVEVVVMEETMQVAVKLELRSSDLLTMSMSMEPMTNQHSEAVVEADVTVHASGLVVAKEHDVLTQCGCAWHWERSCDQLGQYGHEQKNILQIIELMESVYWLRFTQIRDASV